MPDITTTVESSEATIKAVRQDIPIGVGGEAIQRIPYAASLEKLLDTGVTNRVIASTTRCIRIVELPVKGGGTSKFHCSRACVGVAGQQLCPDHDREAFAPSQTGLGPKPAITNSASIKLTKAELEEMGVTDPATERSTVSSKTPPAPKPQPKPKPKPGRPKRFASMDPNNSEGIKLFITLQDLEGKDLLPVLVTLINAALDNLPSGTIARMKKIMALQERIATLGASK